MPRALPLMLAALLAGCATGGGGLTAYEVEQLERRERGIAASPFRVQDESVAARIRELLARIEPGLALRIYVVQQSAPQAEIIGGQVLLVRTGLLDVAPEDDELAFVLAHELAHAALGHVAARRDPAWDAAAAERAADAWALERTRRLGLDPAAAVALLRRLALLLDGADRASVEARADALAQGLAF